MTPGDIFAIFEECNLFDHRFGEPNPREAGAWWRALRDLQISREEAVATVALHYGHTTEKMMAANVRQIANQLREERRRLEPSAPRALPSRFDDSLERRVVIERGAATAGEVLAQIADGIAALRGDRPSALDQLRELTSDPEIGDVNVDDSTDGEAAR